MILPHSQGDPSGTYIESAGLGVPIVGFANAALRGHERHAGFAWTVPVGDIDGLVELVRRLADDPAEVQRKALNLDPPMRLAVWGEFPRGNMRMPLCCNRIGVLQASTLWLTKGHLVGETLSHFGRDLCCVR